MHPIENSEKPQEIQRVEQSMKQNIKTNLSKYNVLKSACSQKSSKTKEIQRIEHSMKQDIKNNLRKSIVLSKA